MGEIPDSNYLSGFATSCIAHIRVSHTMVSLKIFRGFSPTVAGMRVLHNTVISFIQDKKEVHLRSL